MNSEEEVIYPDRVLEVCNLIIEDISIEEFLLENQITDVELGRDCARRCICDMFLKKFVAGEELVFKSEDELLGLLSSILAETTLRGLVKKGFVDSIFDPDQNDTVFFLTDKGKVVASELKDDKLESDD